MCLNINCVLTKLKAFERKARDILGFSDPSVKLTELQTFPVHQPTQDTRLRSLVDARGLALELTQCLPAEKLTCCCQPGHQDVPFLSPRFTPSHSINSSSSVLWDQEACESRVLDHPRPGVGSAIYFSNEGPLTVF